MVAIVSCPVALLCCISPLALPTFFGFPNKVLEGAAAILAVACLHVRGEQCICPPGVFI